MPFGPKQRGKPTPQWASDLMDLIIRILGIISGFIVVVDFIPSKVSNILSPVLTALLIPLAFELKKWFSSQTTKKKVDIKDVTVLKDEADETPK